MADTTITLAMTGASGSAYGLRLLEELLARPVRVYFMISNPGRMVLAQEAGLKLSGKASEIGPALAKRYEVHPRAELHAFGTEDWFSPPASGSNPANAMVICPCTTGTLAEIAAGTSRSLIDRAADVSLKEQRKLILVVRETPLSTVHLENMLRLARAGAIIMPACPGFYFNPESVQDVVDFLVARVLDHLGLEHDLAERWGAARLDRGHASQAAGKPD